MATLAADIVIVGSGASGSVAAEHLTAQGFSVIVLEAGRRYHPPTDLANSEANAAKILWTEPRVAAGKHAIMPKTGVGLGGGTLVWLGVAPRFHPADFRTHSTEGIGTDWPISYSDLRPYYQQVERDFGVAGDCGPFPPEPYTLPMPAHPMNRHAQVLALGARQLGAQPFAPPVAINSVPYRGRPACIYCGWCGSGCPSGAKATALDTYLAAAEQRGARVITEAFVHRIDYDAALGRATGVTYLDREHRERQVKARVVILAAHALETPRLLLLSANATFPHGLANSSGLVGRHLMSHPTWQVFGTFDEPIRSHEGFQMGQVMVQDYYRPDPRNAYARGFALISYMMTPITYSTLSGSFIGAELKRFLHDYEYTAAWWAHAEGLPDARNTVTLDPERRDTRGLPVARLTYEWGDNDLRLVAAARDKAAAMMEASGARHVRLGLNYGAHAMGTCRMGHHAESSVVDANCRAHDVRNLFIVDTSVFVTGAGVNPTLTAMAIASRAAEHVAGLARKGEC